MKLPIALEAGGAGDNWALQQERLRDLESMGVGVSETTGYDDMYVYEVPYRQ